MRPLLRPLRLGFRICDLISDFVFLISDLVWDLVSFS